MLSFELHMNFKLVSPTIFIINGKNLKYVGLHIKNSYRKTIQYAYKFYYCTNFYENIFAQNNEVI